MTIRLDLPAGFSFRRTVFSHGWYSLPPFRFDAAAGALETTVAAPSGRAHAMRLVRQAGGVVLELARHPSSRDRDALVAAARRVLNLDLDLGPFHARVAADPDFAWIAAAGAGRLLRAPTVFEDLVKLVLTTNCSWALTTVMVGNLVARFGPEAPDGSRAFPTAARLASLSERDWRALVRVGYRAPRLERLCRLVADGTIDPEAWATSALAPRALRAEILRVPGAGPYVAENLLKFLGRPDGLALDAWMRREYARLFHDGRTVSDRTIARRVAGLGPWGGLALWFALTRDWLDDETVGTVGLPAEGRRGDRGLERRPDRLGGPPRQERNP